MTNRFPSLLAGFDEEKRGEIRGTNSTTEFLLLFRYCRDYLGQGQSERERESSHHIHTRLHTKRGETANKNIFFDSITRRASNPASKQAILFFYSSLKSKDVGFVMQ